MNEPASQPLAPPSSVPMRTTFVRPMLDGRIYTTYTGERSTGERNVDEVGPLVVLLLNEWGEDWGPGQRPDGVESGVDFQASGPLGELRLQITRVPDEPEFWRTASSRGLVAVTRTPSEYAEDLIRAIRRKSALYSLAERQKMFLVLDGQAGGAYDAEPVLEAFTELFMSEAQQSGFDDIFLLGVMRFMNLLVPPQPKTAARTA